MKEFFVEQSPLPFIGFLRAERLFLRRGHALKQMVASAIMMVVARKVIVLETITIAFFFFLCLGSLRTWRPNKMATAGAMAIVSSYLPLFGSSGIVARWVVPAIGDHRKWRLPAPWQSDRAKIIVSSITWSVLRRGTFIFSANDDQQKWRRPVLW